MLVVITLAIERVDWRLGPPVAADGIGTAQWQPGELQDPRTDGVRSVHLRVVGRGGDFVFYQVCYVCLYILLQILLISARGVLYC